MFSLVLHGGRLSLLVGVLAAVAGAATGVVIGLVAGYIRWADAVIMRIMDGMMAISGILFAVALVSRSGRASSRSWRRSPSPRSRAWCG